MTPIHPTILSSEKYGNQYRLTIKLVPSAFLGPFERLRFKKNPYCGSFGTSLTKSWLTLDTGKILGSRQGKRFRFGGPIRTWERWLKKRFGKTALL